MYTSKIDQLWSSYLWLTSDLFFIRLLCLFFISVLKDEPASNTHEGMLDLLGIFPSAFFVTCNAELQRGCWKRRLQVTCCCSGIKIYGRFHLEIHTEWIKKVWGYKNDASIKGLFLLHHKSLMLQRQKLFCPLRVELLLEMKPFHMWWIPNRGAPLELVNVKYAPFSLIVP